MEGVIWENWKVDEQVLKIGSTEVRIGKDLVWGFIILSADYAILNRGPIHPSIH